jgi:signal transduction histidine kinase
VALLHLEDIDELKPQDIRAIYSSLMHLKHYLNAVRNQLNNQSTITNFYIDTQVRIVKRVVIPLAKSSNVHLVFSDVPQVKISGYSILFQQLLVNLIVNAIEAYPHDLKADLNRIVKIEFKQNERFLIIKVVDWSDIIPSEEISKIFDKYYSLDSATGNELCIGLGIVKHHVTKVFNGKIDVVSTPKLGTRFTIKIPISSL